MQKERFLLSFFSLCILATAVNAASDVQSIQETPVSAQPRPPLNPLARLAERAGATDCVPLASQVTDYLSGGRHSFGSLFVPSKEVNGQLFSMALEVEDGDALVYATASFSPGAAGCSAGYDTVTYWEASCAEVAAAKLPDLKFMGPLRSKVSMLDGGPTLRIFLMPAGSGCVQIKKEVIFSQP